MKQIALVPFLAVVVACSSHAPKTSVTLTAPTSRSVTDPSGIRLAEKIREYRLGRYADPADPLAMHEAHPVYRVEQTAAWNLGPTGKPPSVQSGPASPRPEATQRDAELAELNKQRAATRVFAEQAATLNQKLAEFTKAVAQTQEIAKQNALLKQEIDYLRERMDTMQKKSGHAQPDALPSPSPRDDKW